MLRFLSPMAEEFRRPKLYFAGFWKYPEVGVFGVLMSQLSFWI